MPSCGGSSQLRNQLGSPALQTDSLPAELPGEAIIFVYVEVIGQDSCLSEAFPFLAIES